MVRTTRPTGPKVVDPDFHRESVWIFARAGADPPGRNPPAGSPVGPASAVVTAEATGIGLKQSPHHGAPGTTLAAQLGQRRVDRSEAMVTFIDSDRPQVDRPHVAAYDSGK
jgi:hypothetical protein